MPNIELHLPVKLDGSVAHADLTALTAAAVLDGTKSYFTANAATAAFTITLPAANSGVGLVVVVKKIDSTTNAVTIAAAGTDKIDGAATQVLNSQFQAVELISDGSSEWHINSSGILQSPAFNGSVVVNGNLNASSVTTAATQTDIVTLSTSTVLDGTRSLILANAVTAAFTITLPSASLFIGLRIEIHKIDSSTNQVTIAPAGSDTIDGSQDALITKFQNVAYVSDGAAWHVIGGTFLQDPSVQGSVHTPLTIDGLVTTNGVLLASTGYSYEVNNSGTSVIVGRVDVSGNVHIGG